MKKNNFKKTTNSHFKRALFTALLAGVIALGTLAGCNASNQGNSGNEEKTNTDESTKVRTVNIAATPGYKPITYINEDGDLDGYDIVVFKAIDERLPQYEFTFEAVDKEALNIGVETNKYQVGLNGMFRSKEREEKFLIPENLLGATRVGSVLRADETGIASWDDLVGKRLSPLQVSGGIYALILTYNEKHPDSPIAYQEISTSDRVANYQGLRDNVYDAVPELVDIYNQIQDPDVIRDLKISNTFEKVSTYPIINRSETELLAIINEQLDILLQDGTLSKIALEYYGADVFAE
ncbi:MAG: transporter substrate-binding domain-containing protein [Syntrophomonadaceae bacterium]|jgi:L-cystine transport system substrate-binding protein|nr:transporter substrate-binding domain-containing protein [Syntrophomonadaceae bacterium]